MAAFRIPNPTRPGAPRAVELIHGAQLGLWAEAGLEIARQAGRHAARRLMRDTRVSPHKLSRGAAAAEFRLWWRTGGQAQTGARSEDAQRAFTEGFFERDNPAPTVTDRAQRYRAQAAIEQPEQRCIYCGAPAGRGRKLDVEHINGKEADNAPENLAYACRSCNTAKGALFARLKIGKKTRQYNPAPAGGAQTFAQYMAAVMSITPHVAGKHAPGSGPMDPLEARDLIRATPPARRSSFARQAWKRRAARSSEVPF